jgi:hypothetical protein
MLIIPGGLITLITLHVYLVIRLGVTEPPWTRGAGGYDFVEDGAGPARKGLVEPRPRGNGSMGGPARTEVKR